MAVAFSQTGFWRHFQNPLGSSPWDVSRYRPRFLGGDGPGGFQSILNVV